MVEPYQTPVARFAIAALIMARCHELGLSRARLVQLAGYKREPKGIRRLYALMAGDCETTRTLIGGLPAALNSSAGYDLSHYRANAATNGGRRTSRRRTSRGAMARHLRAARHYFDRAADPSADVSCRRHRRGATAANRFQCQCQAGEFRQPRRRRRQTKKGPVGQQRRCVARIRRANGDYCELCSRLGRQVRSCWRASRSFCRGLSGGASSAVAQGAADSRRSFAASRQWFNFMTGRSGDFGLSPSNLGFMF